MYVYSLRPQYSPRTAGECLGFTVWSTSLALIRIGRAISILIVGGYAFELSVLIALAVFSVKVLKHKKEELFLDERDKQILYKSLYASHLVLCTGLFISIGVLALGFNAFWVFNCIVLAFFLSVVAELVTKLFFYKRET